MRTKKGGRTRRVAGGLGGAFFRDGDTERNAMEDCVVQRGGKGGGPEYRGVYCLFCPACVWPRSCPLPFFGVMVRAGAVDGHVYTSG